MKNLLLDTQSTCVIILFNISTYSIYGYYYKVYLGSMKSIYIIYVVLHVMTSAQWSWLLSGMKWCNYLWKSLMSYPRLRFLGEGPCQRALFSNWWSYNNLVSLLCLWTYSWRLCSNLNFGHILEEHGCPIWSLAHWSIRVDPCLKSIYNYIYFIIPLYILITTITMSIIIPTNLSSMLAHFIQPWLQVYVQTWIQKVLVVALCLPIPTIYLEFPFII